MKEKNKSGNLVQQVREFGPQKPGFSYASCWDRIPLLEMLGFCSEKHFFKHKKALQGTKSPSYSICICIYIYVLNGRKRAKHCKSCYVRASESLDSKTMALCMFVVVHELSSVWEIEESEAGVANGGAAIVPLSKIGTRYGNSASIASCLQNQRLNSASTDSPLQRIKEKSRYGISVSTPHRRYGHRLRTLFFADPISLGLRKHRGNLAWIFALEIQIIESMLPGCAARSS